MTSRHRKLVTLVFGLLADLLAKHTLVIKHIAETPAGASLHRYRKLDMVNKVTLQSYSQKVERELGKIQKPCCLPLRFYAEHRGKV